jgi:hypothetical protein
MTQGSLENQNQYGMYIKERERDRQTDIVEIGLGNCGDQKSHDLSSVTCMLENQEG